MDELITIALRNNGREFYIYHRGGLLTIRSVADIDSVLSDIRGTLEDANRESARNAVAQTLGISPDEVSDSEVDEYLAD